MTIEEFLRTYKVRAPNLMWFLGAGASAAAGVPTADNLTWQFKRDLFCAAQRVSVRRCEDLSSPGVRERLNSYFESLGSFPVSGSSEEYARYFETTYPDPADRRAVLEGYVAGAQPTYGHLALAGLALMGQARIVWTCNFDKLIEDAAAQIFGSTSSFVSASLDNPDVILEAINEGRWPLIAKIHGDFQSRRLKNTQEELQKQDARVRAALVESCARYGLVVVGYSGRDESIIHALEDGIHNGRGYPAGLFWLRRPDFASPPSVERLIQKALDAGVRAEFVEVQTFDELLGDIVRQLENVPQELAKRLNRHGSRITDAPLSMPGRGWPVIRLNALPLTGWPTRCTRVVCSIGGTKEVREAIEQRGTKAVATRSRGGVLAFGSDSEIRRALSPFEITDFAPHVIEQHRLGFDSAEFGLLRVALVEAIARVRPVKSVKRSGHLLLPDFDRASVEEIDSLRRCAGELKGAIPGTSVDWAEALRLRLDYRLERLWLVVEPTIYFGDSEEKEQRYKAASFVREKLAVRYNRQWNSMLDAWIAFLLGDEQEVCFNTFDISDGLDASFRLTRVTAFSRRYEASR
jgi:SIR2-like domain